MSYGFRFYKTRQNKGWQAKFTVTQTMEYVVNFVSMPDTNGTEYYEVFFHPSMKMINGMTSGTMIPSSKYGNPAIANNVFLTVRNVINAFAKRFAPDSMKFTNQFSLELNRFTSASIPGYHVIRGGIGDGSIILRKN